MEIPLDLQETIRTLNCSFRFIAKSSTFKDSPQLGGPPIQDFSTACHICEIIDLSTGKVYHREIGQPACPEIDLLRVAVNNAIKAPKPKTPAQEAEDILRERANSATAELDVKDQQLQDAMKKIAAMERKMEAMANKQALADVGVET
jgi:hypothetical protein